MRIKILLVTLLCFVLQSCVAPALMLSPQSQLLWALLKPMVGMDPNEANFFQQPMIKSRLQPLLGEHYDTAVTLLSTATELQQQGPMFFLVSKHSPLPAVAEKAGFVWNSDTNQMAVLLVSGGAPTVFAEQVKQQGQNVIPQWPAELAEYTDPDKLRAKALAKAAQTVTTELPLEGKAKALTEAAITQGDAKSVLQTEVKQQQQALVDEVKKPVLAPLEQKQTELKQQISTEKAELKDKAEDKAKALIKKEQPALSDEDALSAELSQEQQAIRTAGTSGAQPATPTAAQQERIKQAEIRLEQAKVLLKAAQDKEKTGEDKTQAKLMVLAAKDQVRKAEAELAAAKQAAGQ